jgi:RHS repeat-associated protein
VLSYKNSLIEIAAKSQSVKAKPLTWANAIRRIFRWFIFILSAVCIMPTAVAQNNAVLIPATYSVGYFAYIIPVCFGSTSNNTYRCFPANSAAYTAVILTGPTPNDVCDQQAANIDGFNNHLTSVYQGYQGRRLTSHGVSYTYPANPVPGAISRCTILSEEFVCANGSCQSYPGNDLGSMPIYQNAICPAHSSLALLEPVASCQCDEGYIAEGTACIKDKRVELTCDADCATSQPIIPATGEKIKTQVDYVDSARHPLSWVRDYRSSNSVQSGTFGVWRHNYSATAAGGTGTSAEITLSDSSVRSFSRTNTTQSTWTAANHAGQLTSLATGQLRYTHTEDNSTWLFSPSGQLQSATQRNGWVHSYTYTSQPVGSTTVSLLTRVTNQFGRFITLAYNASGYLIQVTPPDGRAIGYVYDSQNRLSTVRYATSPVTSKTYLYENAAFPNALTGITDENNVRHGTYAYDAQGRAISSELAGAVERYSVSYPASASATTVVIDPLGTARNYRYSTNASQLSVTAADKPSNTGTGDAASRVQNAFGLTDSETDFLGLQTLYTWDTARRLPLTVTRAAGRPEAQTVSTQWHPTLSLPTLVTEQGASAGVGLRTTAYTYDALGNKLTETRTDTATSQARTTAYTYTPQGLLATMADPRSAAAGPSSAPWQFTYDALGNRTRVKNPLNQETVYTHDAAGRTLTETAPNGLRSAYTYDLRGRLLTATTSPSVAVTTATEVTSYTYTPSGQLASVALPNGYAVTYTYDPAQRLVAAADNRNNRIAYTLDAMGNRTREEVKDPSGQIALATTRSINQLNRVASVAGAVGQTTQMAYDANGNLLSQTDPLNQTTAQTLDALRRPTATRFADNATASQTYNALDQLTQATDPKGVATVYTRNAFGEVISETSPDIGTTAYTRDAVGDVATMTDAKGNITQIVRDLLGRPTQVTRSATDQSFFTWDAGTTGSQIGHLSKLQDKSGTTTYERDAFGRILSKTQTVNDNPASPSSYKTAYTYSTAATGGKGELSSITYPSGLKVHYSRSASGQISAISTQVPGTGKPITPFVTGLTYTALGQPKAWSWAFNGDAAARTFDTDGRMTSSELASYTFDAASRITAITQQLWASRTVTQTVGTGTATVTEYYKVPLTWTAGYDTRNRLTGFTRAGSQTSYTYDPNSNRLTSIDKTSVDIDQDNQIDATDTATTTAQTASLQATSNRLLGFSQTITKVKGTQTLSTTAASVTYSIDANGNLTSDGLRTFEYDESNRLSKVKILKDGEAASIKYLYNALGQQVFKSEPKPDQLLPNQTELGTGFINWLKTNFGWLYATAQTNASIGSAFLYADGQLPSWAVLGEYDNGSASGTGRTEYIWLPTEDGSAIPVGFYRNSKFYAIHPDHLGTPRLVTDNTNKVVWQWAYSGFGNNKPMGVLKPTTSATTAFTNQPVLLAAPAAAAILDLRFPGQMADEETGLFYNYFRSYMPSGGRYTQADPIGLDGGWNRFGYVDGNPLSMTDPLGLQAAMPWPAPVMPLVPALTNLCLANPVACAGGVGVGAGTLLYPHIAEPLGDAIDWCMNNTQQDPLAPAGGKEHTSGARPSTEGQHQAGQGRKKQDRGGESGDASRGWPRRKPDGWKGPWPPKN